MSSTIIQFSDLHVQDEKDTERIDIIGGYASKHKADALVLAGDITDGFGIGQALQKNLKEHLDEEEQQFLDLVMKVDGSTPEQALKGEELELFKKLKEKYDNENFLKKINQGQKKALHSAAKKFSSAVDSRLEEIVKKGTKVIGVLGNHEFAFSPALYKSVHWLDQEGIEINGIRYEGTTNLQGANPAIFPPQLYPHLSPQNGEEDYERIKQGWKDSKKRILVAHYAFKEKMLGDTQYEHFPEIEKLVKEDKPMAVLSGHTHKDAAALLFDEKIPVFVSSHLAGYRHVINDKGEIAESYRLWLVDEEKYKKDKDKLNNVFNVYSAAN